MTGDSHAKLKTWHLSRRYYCITSIIHMGARTTMCLTASSCSMHLQLASEARSMSLSTTKTALGQRATSST